MTQKRQRPVPVGVSDGSWMVEASSWEPPAQEGLEGAKKPARKGSLHRRWAFSACARGRARMPPVFWELC